MGQRCYLTSETTSFLVVNLYLSCLCAIPWLFTLKCIPASQLFNTFHTFYDFHKCSPSFLPEEVWGQGKPLPICVRLQQEGDRRASMASLIQQSWTPALWDFFTLGPLSGCTAQKFWWFCTLQASRMIFSFSSARGRFGSWRDSVSVSWELVSHLANHLKLPLSLNSLPSIFWLPQWHISVTS